MGVLPRWVLALACPRWVGAGTRTSATWSGPGRRRRREPRPCPDLTQNQTGTTLSQLFCLFVFSPFCFFAFFPFFPFVLLVLFSFCPFVLLSLCPFLLLSLCPYVFMSLCLFFMSLCLYAFFAYLSISNNTFFLTFRSWLSCAPWFVGFYLDIGFKRLHRSWKQENPGEIGKITKTSNNYLPLHPTFSHNVSSF